MSLISLLIVLIVAGVLLWWVNKYVPMDPTLKHILTGVVVLIVILWLLSALGVLGAVDQVRVPRLR